MRILLILTILQFLNTNCAIGINYNTVDFHCPEIEEKRNHDLDISILAIMKAHFLWLYLFEYERYGAPYRISLSYMIRDTSKYSHIILTDFKMISNKNTIYDFLDGRHRNLLFVDKYASFECKKQHKFLGRKFVLKVRFQLIAKNGLQEEVVYTYDIVQIGRASCRERVCHRV